MGESDRTEVAWSKLSLMNCPMDMHAEWPFTFKNCILYLAQQILTREEPGAG